MAVLVALAIVLGVLLFLLVVVLLCQKEEEWEGVMGK
jgi:hypothetical protein